MAGLRDERIIFIFDEFHRSQFGDTHQRITAFFRNHQMFGLTGTPIFSSTANEEDKDADGMLDEDGETIGGEGGNPLIRGKLDGFISDYNRMFATKFFTKDTQSFYGHYQEIARKVKQRKVDIQC
jgi:type I site-specific restriction-modification system R (restriction) subunit